MKKADSLNEYIEANYDKERKKQHDKNYPKICDWIAIVILGLAYVLFSYTPLDPPEVSRNIAGVLVLLTTIPAYIGFTIDKVIDEAVKDTLKIRFQGGDKSS